MEPIPTQPVVSRTTVVTQTDPSITQTVNVDPGLETVQAQSGGWMKWGIAGGVILFIVIILIIICIIWWVNSSSDSCDKPISCQRKNRGARITDIDGNVIDKAAANQAVALLELTGNGWIELDRSIAAILEVYNSERPSNQQVIIMDTQSDTELTKTLWMKAVQDGHRKFIGGSQSGTLTQLQSLINSRPDTAFISVGSTAPSLAQRDNIYRMIRDDTNLLPAIPEFLSKRFDYIQILEQVDSLWARELTQLMSDALQASGVRVGITKIGGLLTTSSNDENNRSDDVVRNSDHLNDNLSRVLPTDSNIAFLSIIDSNIAQYVYSMIDDAPWAHYQHFAFDTLVLFPFEGRAASAARKTKLQVISYNPEGTLESEAVLRQVSQDNIHPLAPSAYDAAVALERIGLNIKDSQNLENYFMENRGITGLLTVNEKGDRITNPYLLWNYDDGNWTPSLIFGREIPYGDFVGSFGAPVPNNGPSDCRDTGRYSNENCDEPYSDEHYDESYSPRYSDKPYSPRYSDKPYSPRYSDKPYSPRYSDKPYSPRYSDKLQAEYRDDDYPSVKGYQSYGDE
jgi:hypothetical protein